MVHKRIRAKWTSAGCRPRAAEARPAPAVETRPGAAPPPLPAGRIRVAELASSMLWSAVTTALLGLAAVALLGLNVQADARAGRVPDRHGAARHLERPGRRQGRGRAVPRPERAAAAVPGERPGPGHRGPGPGVVAPGRSPGELLDVWPASGGGFPARVLDRVRGDQPPRVVRDLLSACCSWPTAAGPSWRPAIARRGSAPCRSSAPA